MKGVEGGASISEELGDSEFRIHDSRCVWRKDSSRFKGSKRSEFGGKEIQDSGLKIQDAGKTGIQDSGFKTFSEFRGRRNSRFRIHDEGGSLNLELLTLNPSCFTFTFFHTCYRDPGQW